MSFTSLITDVVQKVSAKNYKKPKISKALVHDLNIITNSFCKSKAPLKAVVAATMSKIIYPEWDTRYHQIQIGGEHSLRTIDSNHICPEMYKFGLYDTITSFALTRSFEKAEAFDKHYSGNISPNDSKISFLNILEKINKTKSCRKTNYHIIEYIVYWLYQQKKELKVIKETDCSFEEITAETTYNTIQSLMQLGSGSSCVPVVVVYTCCQILYTSIDIMPLKHHTASDHASRSIADIEGCDENNDIVLAIEIKHNLALTDGVLNLFDNKSKNVKHRFLLTTKKINTQYACGNISIGNVTNFCMERLNFASLNDSTVYERFLIKCYENLLNYQTLDVSIKSKLKNIFENN